MELWISCSLKIKSKTINCVIGKNKMDNVNVDKVIEIEIWIN